MELGGDKAENAEAYADLPNSQVGSTRTSQLPHNPTQPLSPLANHFFLCLASTTHSLSLPSPRQAAVLGFFVHPPLPPPDIIGQEIISFLSCLAIICGFHLAVQSRLRQQNYWETTYGVHTLRT